MGIAGQAAASQHGLQLQTQRAFGQLDACALGAPFGGVTHDGEVAAPRGGHHPLHGHLAARQRAGLVRRDDGGRPERFDRGQLLDDGVVARHAPHAHRQHHRQDRRQALGHGGDGQRYAQQQYRDDIGHALNVRGEQDRAHHNGGDRQRRDTQHLAQMRDLDLKWRRCVGGGVQQGGNAAHLGLHAGGGDDGAPAALRDRRALEHHVQPVAQRRNRRQRRRILQHRLALAGQRRLQQLQGGGLCQPRIGAHGIAFSEDQHIALDQFCAGYTDDGAVTQHGRGGRGHLCQRRHRLRRLGLLQPAQHRIQHHHERDDDGIQRPAGRTGLTPAFEPPGRQRHGGSGAQ